LTARVQPQKIGYFQRPPVSRRKLIVIFGGPLTAAKNKQMSKIVFTIFGGQGGRQKLTISEQFFF
jgi:hypothetical protein